MSKDVPLSSEDSAFVRAEFQRYYRSSPPDPPLQFPRREFAAFPFGTVLGMRRHMAFDQPAGFRSFVEREVPRHLYYSTAYYERPEHAQMALKGWLGADVIFDLDADHLRGAEGLDYPGQLALVKEKFVLLLDEFLFRDFGIDPAEMLLAFSGGRGYHAHLRSAALLPLTSAERRELVEYVMGVGVNPRCGLREERERSSEPGWAPDPNAGSAAGPRGGSSAGRLYTRLEPPDSPGWPGHVSRSVLRLFDRWKNEGPEAASAELIAAGMKPSEARRLAKALIDEDRASWVREDQGYTLDIFKGLPPQPFLELVTKQATVEVQGEADAPVTTDIHRLIRLPGSRHGGTGLRVVPLTRDQLDSFDPLRDALAPEASAARTRVHLIRTVRYPFGTGALEGSAGEEIETGSAGAVFLILRGDATLRPSGPGSGAPSSPPSAPGS
jgi:DNA primase small subunit